MRFLRRLGAAVSAEEAWGRLRMWILAQRRAIEVGIPALSALEMRGAVEAEEEEEEDAV